MRDISELSAIIAELLNFKPRRIRQPRTAHADGKVYSRYSPAHLRKVRTEKGVGRPPHITVMRLAAE